MSLRKQVPSREIVSYSESLSSQDDSTSEDSGFSADAAQPAAMAQAGAPALQLPYRTAEGTHVLSLGKSAAVPGSFSRRLGVLLPEGFMALAEEKVTGKMFRLEIIKAELDRLKYKVTDVCDESRFRAGRSPTMACKIMETSYSGPRLFGLHDKQVRRDIKARYPEGGHQLAAQLAADFKEKKRKDKKRKAEASQKAKASSYQRKCMAGGASVDEKLKSVMTAGMAGPSSQPLDPFQIAPELLLQLKSRVLETVREYLLQSPGVKLAFLEAEQQAARLKSVLSAADQLPLDSQAALKDMVEKDTEQFNAKMAASPPFNLYHQLDLLFDADV